MISGIHARPPKTFLALDVKTSPLITNLQTLPLNHELSNSSEGLGFESSLYVEKPKFPKPELCISLEALSRSQVVTRLRPLNRIPIS